jgi:hypothetical protein
MCSQAQRPLEEINCYSRSEGGAGSSATGKMNGREHIFWETMVNKKKRRRLKEVMVCRHLIRGPTFYYFEVLHMQWEFKSGRKRR